MNIPVTHGRHGHDDKIESVHPGFILDNLEANGAPDEDSRKDD